jgi:NAD(P)-dependent dehydrogenase (short-subunit alcohol dehydrogenase family)
MATGNAALTQRSGPSPYTPQVIPEGKIVSQPVILITGALTGIGRATALAFADSGAHLVISGRRATASSLQVFAELQQLGAQALSIQADVRHDEEVRALVDQTVARFGRIDVAVNNPGTEGQPGLIVNQTADSYAATFDTNVPGALLGMKHELRVMTAQKRGSIINSSATSGHKGAAYAPVYAGSKHAVEGFTRSVAPEVAASGVRVNAVAPGPTDTGMLDRFTGKPKNKAALASGVPLGRVGKPADIAAAELFLASEGAAFVTGQIVTVDGGKTAG